MDQTTEQKAAAYSAAGVAPAPVGYLSSENGQNIVNQNTSKLQTIESAYNGPSIVDFLNSGGKPSDFASRSKLATDNGISGYTGTADQNTQLLGKLRNPSGSPAMGSMVNDLNSSVSGGGMTADEQKGYSSLLSAQDAAQVAAAQARAALENGDYKSMDSYTKAAEQAKQSYIDNLTSYYQSTADLRKNAAALMVPGAQEQQISKSLADIRSQADQFALQTQKDKHAEYSGQTLGFANGRAAELDYKASFQNQEYALKEKNLLTELGLAQDQRTSQLNATNTELGNLKDDYALQTQVQDKLDAQDEKLFQAADKLQANSKDVLLSILDQLKGVDPSKLPAASLTQLETLAARSGVPFDLVKSALQSQYQRQTFEDAKSGLLSVTDAKALGVPYGTTVAEARGISPSDQTSPTQVQQQAALYAQRVADSGKTLDSLESTIAKYNPLQFTAEAAAETNPVGNAFVSDTVRQVRQAERNFATAVLRRESGAAISASEFSTLEKQYFPRPGDDAKTLAAKKQARDRQEQGIAQEAGKALKSSTTSSSDPSSEGWF